jgi:hypothetical protein
VGVSTLLVQSVVLFALLSICPVRKSVDKALFLQVFNLLLTWT